MRTPIKDLNETLSKLNKDRDNLNMFISNQTYSYKKVVLGCEQDSNAKSFMSIFLDKEKKNRSIYKRNYYHKARHFEPCFSKMYDIKWSKRSNFDEYLKYINTKESKKIQGPKNKNLILFFKDTLQHQTQIVK